MNPDGKPIKIAMVGTKGIPAKWGGIEKYIEEIGKRLVERGHEVTVFGSRWFSHDFREKTYLGMRICRLPTVHFQATDALSNAFFATAMIAIGNYDIVNFHGYASYLFVPVLRSIGKITVVTAHGVESGWDNPKYGFFARRIAKKAFKVGIIHADLITTVADHLKKKIDQNFNINPEVLPSGLDKVIHRPSQIIKERYGLNGLDYLLFLGRIDPIKRVDWILDLLKVLKGDTKIVIAGGAQNPPTEAYLKSLKQRADNNSKIIFTGPVFGKEKTELLSNCLIFLAPSMNEGLPITILEAISHGRCCLASDIPAHAEVIEHGTTGFLFPFNQKDRFISLAQELEAAPGETLNSVGLRAKETTEPVFNWDHTTDRFIELCQKLCSERNAKKIRQ